MTDEFLKSRFSDLASRAANGSYGFSPFLGLAEQSILKSCQKDLFPFDLFGGTDGCERVMARFGSPELCGYEMPFPITLLKVAPLSRKFSDKLTHRDILGALMSLGIERDEIGDIIIKSEESYVFCTERISDYIVRNLVSVKHTSVSCTAAESLPEGTLFELEDVRLAVSSLRVDGIIAHLYHLSRSETDGLFDAEKVFINGKIAKKSTDLKPGDIVSCRGYGRFIFPGEPGVTKKGRLSVTISKYV